MRRTSARTRVIGLALGSVVLQGCPVESLLNGFFGSCFGSNTISRNEYDDLNIFEQVLYDENDCGRYERVSIQLRQTP